MRTPRALIVGAVALAATLTGCDRKTGEGANSSSAPIGTHASANSESINTIPSVPNLITEQTAGKPTLRLKFNEPATLYKDGVSLTVTPTSFVPARSAPDLGPLNDTDETGCNVWWTVTITVSIDSQPNANWSDWYTSLNDLRGVQTNDYKGKGFDEFQNMHHALSKFQDPKGSASDAKEDPVYEVEKAWKKSRGKQFHDTFEIQQTFSACRYSGYVKEHPNEPDWKAPAGITWEIYKDKKTVIQAVWLLEN